MSVNSILLGYIEEAWPGAIVGTDEDVNRRTDLLHTIARHNDGIIQGLPEDDEYPPVSRLMFGSPPPQTRMITYTNRLLHLGAELKNFDYWMRNWLDKFEHLLRRMYWETAYVRVERGYLGTSEFKWEADLDWLCDMRLCKLRPVSAWEFTSSRTDLDSLRDGIA